MREERRQEVEEERKAGRGEAEEGEGEKEEVTVSERRGGGKGGHIQCTHQKVSQRQW